MNISKIKFSLKEAIISTISLYFLIFVTSYLALGPNKIFDAQTLLLSLGTLCFLGLIIQLSPNYIFTQSAVMAGFFLLYIMSGLALYLICPEMVVFPFGPEISSHQINAALFYMLIGSVLIYAGFWAAEIISKPFQTPPNSPEPPSYKSNSILAVVLISLFSASFAMNFLGFSMFGPIIKGKYNALLQLMLSIFNIDVVVFLGCASFLIKKHIGKRDVFMIALLAAIYCIFFIFSGSRGISLRFETFIITILLCKQGNFKITLKYAVVFIAFLLLSFCTFPFATQQRMDKSAQIRRNLGQQVQVVSFWERNDVHSGTTSHTSDQCNSKVFSLEKGKTLFASVINRMSLMNYATLILSVEPDPLAKATFMNLTYAAKNIVNLLVPGVIFKDAELNTSRLISVLYRGISETYVKNSGYNSEFYTPWGIFFLIFGWWNGLLMLFFAGVCVQLTYLLIMRFGRKYRHHIGALCLLIFSNLFYSNMGIDHWIATSILTMESGVAALILFASGDCIISKVFRQKNLHGRKISTQEPNGDISFAVVIPTKNRLTDLLSAVESVVKQTRKTDELIVIDQSITNIAEGQITETLKGFPSIKFKYIFNSNLTGLTAAKNVAVKIAESEVLLFIDDDIVLDPEFIEVLDRTYAQYPELSGVGGVVRLPEHRQNFLRDLIAPLFQIGPFYDVRNLLQYGYNVDSELVPVNVLSGGLSSLKKEVLNHELFNEDLQGASPIEDMDYFLRVSRKFKFGLATKALALHNVSQISREGIRRVFERKTSGFAYIYSRYIPKTLFNLFAFLLKNAGILIDALASATTHRTIEPVAGVFSAWKSDIFKKKQCI